MIKIAEQAFAGEKKEFPAFKAGDQITVGFIVLKRVTRSVFRSSAVM